MACLRKTMPMTTWVNKDYYFVTTRISNIGRAIAGSESAAGGEIAACNRPNVPKKH